MIRLLGIVWVEARWLVESLGYWVRPYDMLADARRWRWQPRQRCGWSDFAIGTVEELREDDSGLHVNVKLSGPLTRDDVVRIFNLPPYLLK